MEKDLIVEQAVVHILKNNKKRFDCKLSALPSKQV